MNDFDREWDEETPKREKHVIDDPYGDHARTEMAIIVALNREQAENSL